MNRSQEIPKSLTYVGSALTNFSQFSTLLLHQKIKTSEFTHIQSKQSLIDKTTQLTAIF